MAKRSPGSTYQGDKASCQLPPPVLYEGPEPSGYCVLTTTVNLGMGISQLFIVMVKADDSFSYRLGLTRISFLLMPGTVSNASKV